MGQQVCCATSVCATGESNTTDFPERGRSNSKFRGKKDLAISTTFVLQIEPLEEGYNPEKEMWLYMKPQSTDNPHDLSVNTQKTPLGKSGKKTLMDGERYGILEQNRTSDKVNVEAMEGGLEIQEVYELKKMQTIDPNAQAVATLKKQKDSQSPLLALETSNGDSFCVVDEAIKRNIDIRVVSGGPVTPLFQARTDIKPKHLCFSQRRAKGFRSAFEFDRKRVLVSDEKQIQVFGYAEDMQPFHVVSYHIDQEEYGDGQHLNTTNNEERKQSNFSQNKFELLDQSQSRKETIRDPNLPQSDEKIQFAGFLSDFDPTLIFVLTHSQDKNVSYLKVLKIDKKDDERSYSVFEEQDKAEVMQNVRTGLYENEQANRAPNFQDNYAITLDQKKQTMNVVKRGQGTVKINANVPEIGIAKRIQRDASPQSRSRGIPEEGSVSDVSTVFRFKDKEQVKDSPTIVTTSMDGQINKNAEMLYNYQVFSSKLVKFRDTKLRAVKFTQSGSRGKLLITFDQRGLIRFHKIRGLKILQQHDFTEPDQNLDYIFTNQIETTRIELKHELQDMIKPTTISQNPSEDPPEGNQLLASKQDNRLSDDISQEGSGTLQIKTVLYYAGHILAAYEGASFVDVFRVNGPLVERLELEDFFTSSKLLVSQINFIVMPRLDWQDRQFDTEQRAQKQIPRKIVFAGKYQSAEMPSIVDAFNGDCIKRKQPFLMLFDRVKVDQTVTRAFKSRGHISAVSYGPYDNGHILVGTTTGDFFAFDSMRLEKICNVKISEYPVTNITIEPTQMVFCSVQETQEVSALTFIEQKQKYIYMELGMRKYATVIMKTDELKKRTKSKEPRSPTTRGCII